MNGYHGVRIHFRRENSSAKVTKDLADMKTRERKERGMGEAWFICSTRLNSVFTGLFFLRNLQLKEELAKKRHGSWAFIFVPSGLGVLAMLLWSPLNIQASIVGVAQTRGGR